MMMLSQPMSHVHQSNTTQTFRHRTPTLNRSLY